MLAYIVRRLAYALPILLGVNIITFALFFGINSPDDIARAHLGDKHISQTAITSWKHNHGYDKPLFYNADQTGPAKLTDTLFAHKVGRLFVWQFGQSARGRDIARDIQQRMWPSLALAVPTLLLGLLTNISIAMLMAFFRGQRIDKVGMLSCVVLLSISGLFYIIGGQFVVGKLLKLTPISGYNSGIEAIKFVILPVVIGVVSGIGAGGRWYRTLFLEEIEKDYVRSAYANGLPDRSVLFHHVLRNALIPILTGIVAVIPLLFLGSLLMESFFGIPGLGSYTIDAIHQQDFEIVRVMVFIGAVFTLIGLTLTDLAYLAVDPRVKLGTT